MLAFLKRRWILLSCVVVLLACSMCTILGIYPHGTYGLVRGHFLWARISEPWPGVRSRVRLFFHFPKIGTVPSWFSFPGEFTISAPIWLPLSAVIGWLVLRELRWRERRAKSTQACGTN